MKIGKNLLLCVFTLNTSFALMGSQSRLTQEELERIKAKYGLATSSTKNVPTKKETTSYSMAGDLEITSKIKKETAQTGKKLQNQQLDKTTIENLDKEINTNESKEELEEIEDEAKKIEKNPEKVADEAPGLLKSIFGLPKLWYRINRFNSIASQNIKRFNTTFKNVGESLASLEDDYILVPKKNRDGSYATGVNKLILWEEVPAKKITSTMIEQLKNECQYIIIKEMVDGFKHLQPVIGPVLDAFYYLAPKLASQSRLIYDTASQFLPMLETLSKENIGQK